MTSLARVQNGIVKYIDREIICKLCGWQKWTFGALSAIWIANISNTFSALKQNKIVATLGVVDERDMIDIDKLYEQFRRQAEHGAITVDVPIIGAMTLDQRDVDKIYQYIMEE